MGSSVAAKKPEIETILFGPTEKNKLNKNFKAIADKFEEFLSRAGVDYPNFMGVNLDVSDATITNTRRLELNVLTVQDVDFTGFGEQYVYKLGLLSCGEGAVITHDPNGDPVCKAPGDNGQVLKTSGESVVWAEDLDTDNDTVGVTVQEDGVTVAENVTNINFLWTETATPLVTTPASDQVDLAIGELKNIQYWESELGGNTSWSGSSFNLQNGSITFSESYGSAPASSGRGFTQFELTGATVGLTAFQIDNLNLVWFQEMGGLNNNGSFPADEMNMFIRTEFWDEGNTTMLSRNTATATTVANAGATVFNHTMVIPVGARYARVTAWHAVLFPLFSGQAFGDHRLEVRGA